MTRVVGVDPSLTSTGIAVAAGGRVAALTRVRSKRRGPERVEEILTAVATAVWGRPRRPGEAPPPGVVVGVEGPAMTAKGSAVVQMFGLWGVLTHELWRWGVPVYVVTPGGRAKYATGKGNASKDAVLAAVVRRYLEVDVDQNDVADALVIAAMGARRYGVPLETSMPAVNLTAMVGVDWPG